MWTATARSRGVRALKVTRRFRFSDDSAQGELTLRWSEVSAGNSSLALPAGSGMCGSMNSNSGAGMNRRFGHFRWFAKPGQVQRRPWTLQPQRRPGRVGLYAGSVGDLSRTIPPLVVAAVLFSSGGADSYLLVSNGDDWSAQFAQRWNPAVWGPGETLEWVIAAESGWTSPWVEPAERRQGPAVFETPEEAIPLVAWGLAAWSNIESADIRWEVTGAENVEGDTRDGRNTVVARITPEGILGQGRPWWRRVNGEWMVEECDVLMSPLVVADALAGDPLPSRISGPRVRALSEPAAFGCLRRRGGRLR